MQVNYIVSSLGLALLPFPVGSHAATIWKGPLITYTQPAPDPTFPANQDILTSHVSLTRGNPLGGGTGGMFNGITETSFAKFVSPADTEWAVGDLTNYASLTYSDWTTTGGGNPVHTYPGEQLVVHLVSDDIYLSLQYINLPSGPGFSYIRSTPVSNQAPSITITLSGNTLDLSWPTSGPRLQSQSNDPGLGISTNWSDVSGSTATNHVVVPIDRAGGSTFYRLVLP